MRKILPEPRDITSVLAKKYKNGWEKAYVLAVCAGRIGYALIPWAFLYVLLKLFGGGIVA